MLNFREELNKIKEEKLTSNEAVKHQVDFHLPGSDIYRNVYVIQKEKTTPKKYPRKAGLPSKEPL